MKLCGFKEKCFQKNEPFDNVCIYHDWTPLSWGTTPDDVFDFCKSYGCPVKTYYKEKEYKKLIMEQRKSKIQKINETLRM